MLSPEAWRRAELQLLWAYRADLERMTEYAQPFENSGAWFVLAGCAEIIVGKDQFKAEAGQWIVPPTNGGRIQRFAAGTRLISIRFLACWPDGQPVFNHPRSLILADEQFPQLRVSANALADASAKVGDARMAVQRLPAGFATWLRIEQAFFAFLGDLYQVLAEAGTLIQSPLLIDPRVRQAMQWIREGRIERPMLSRRLSLSVSQLDRLFMEAIGRTPVQYQAAQRLLQVKDALGDKNQPVKAIAYDNGFRRLSQFSAWFHRATGMSPREYRRQSDRRI